MLGENHSLLNDFPEHQETIKQLNNSNQAFAKNAQRYHALDAEIRELELNNAPIDDETLHQLKKERAELKDILYQKILNA
ncbi:YdcH family protein [Colwellia sp. 1_MG-2023]|uniref:YdcH family protein n=1 Tax=Colwellia sp. 1_MG-2023 TaxID=3062649 RepID=UPI0026E3DE8B|nr:YdcH family protein [Colwellia sp. 1_MG-2023]MDO6445436.1 YdcH family protein [Colwellia sp. 1_MG-2023]